MVFNVHYQCLVSSYHPVVRYKFTFLIEIMNRLILDHQNWKPGSTGRPFHPIVGLPISAHPRSRSRDSNPGTSVSRANA
ncbi:unnamed protein product [Schistosoma margrebowiei]|uniref:Uncharacterized protein n=1 Tax=Schistosoma margrebowiei TaxID=48269 RepID=A0AA84ZFJ4_9TREM|nr:unnamed protein product [Schistosoma margrebowiei]